LAAQHLAIILGVSLLVSVQPQLAGWPHGIAWPRYAVFLNGTRSLRLWFWLVLLAVSEQEMLLTQAEMLVMITDEINQQQ
jgi:hypothetical protein